jgi:acyl-CoA synthetase (AMP-forming)/AMP-acid ligase II
MESSEEIKQILAVVPREAPLRDYLSSFLERNEDFLVYYNFNSDKTVARTHYTRGSFWSITKRALSILIQNGLSQRDRHLHYFSGNSPIDLALRLASVILGTIPVTINWQADTLEQVLYKINASGSKLVVVDSDTPHVDAIRASCPHCTITVANSILSAPEDINICDLVARNGTVTNEDTRCIIFTSGTTGKPKGVELTYNNYWSNRCTFESFLELTDQKIKFVPIVVNPMHHTNSTSITDWALRRSGTCLHLLERYTTQYWNVLTGIHEGMEDLRRVKQIRTDNCSDASSSSGSSSVTIRVVAPLVSRHIDFLETYMEGAGASGAEKEQLSSCLKETVLLLGSAPVGPTTCSRLMKYAGRLPTVRFGSTETTLQVCGIPLSLPDEAVLSAFRRGWEHSYNGNSCEGFYIGRDHFPHTEVDIVLSVRQSDSNYMKVLLAYLLPPLFSCVAAALRRGPARIHCNARGTRV